MIFEFELSDDDGQILVKMARNAVTEYLQNNTRINNKEFNSRFNIDSGIFVTITKENSLRGCIGYPLPIKKLSNAVIDSAIAAATEDPRFSPINPNELNNLIFEITVLTPPIEINVEKYEDYLSIIKVGRDGLIVENKQCSGLLLPQVPKEYGWDIEEFLAHTSEKAGLEKNAWKDQDTKVSRFEGIIFKEESPNGKIVRGIL
jgi:hypothetical protein